MLYIAYTVAAHALVLDLSLSLRFVLDLDPKLRRSDRFAAPSDNMGRQGVRV